MDSHPEQAACAMALPPPSIKEPESGLHVKPVIGFICQGVRNKFPFGLYVTNMNLKS